MEQSNEYRLGAEVNATDGLCGVVTRVVVDPVDRSVTYLVVEPKHRFGLGRLVPVDQIDIGPHGIRFRGDLAAFAQLESAENVYFMPGSRDWPGEEIVDPVVTDTLPTGEVALRPGNPVHAKDGEIGVVEGFITDRENRHVTHVLLREGHLLNRKEVAIPVAAISGVDRGIRLNLTKDEVEHLPALHPEGS
jgi:hypothetical protein